MMQIQAKVLADLCGALSSKQGFVGRSSDGQSSFHQAAGDARMSEDTNGADSHFMFIQTMQK